MRQWKSSSPLPPQSPIINRHLSSSPPLLWRQQIIRLSLFWHVQLLTLMLSIMIGVAAGTTLPPIIVMDANGKDIGETTFTGRLKVASTPPRIISWDLVRLPDFVSVKDMQIDTQTTLLCEVIIRDESGWELPGGMYMLNITAWFDEGNDTRYQHYSIEDAITITTPPPPISYCHNDSRPGGNFNFKIHYNHRTKSLNLLWPHNGEIILKKELSGYELINYYTGRIWVVFTIGNQTRHAPGDFDWDYSEGYNDRSSWNFNITVVDGEGYTDFVRGEFGIYRYTAIEVTNLYPKLVGYPGSRTASDKFSLLIVSNDAYWLNVSIKTDLMLIRDRRIKIDSSYLSFNSSDPEAEFTNVTGDSGGWSATFKVTSAPANNTYELIRNCYYEIYIPIGTYGGEYKGGILYTVTQRPPK